MNIPNRIKSVRWLGEYRLKLVFKDGYIGEVDLQPIAEAPRGPLAEPLRDISFFQQVRCDDFTAAWPNGYDVCPDVLRYWCELGRVCSKQELDAAFVEILKPENSVSLLNDQLPH